MRTTESNSPRVEPVSRRMEAYFDRLWPICRSIMGPGIRESLDILSEIIPLDRLRFASGQKIFDWTVPKEWIVRDAYLIDPHGVKKAAFKDCNLHLLNYSVPFQGEMSLEDLQSHLYSLPEQPDAIPYLTSYYKERWGFCLTHRERESLPAGTYQVVVDTELKNGLLEIGEAVIPGETDKEVLLSTYLCHPSMANNELSGPLALAFLYERIKFWPRRRMTYRFLVSAETIGTISFLSMRGPHLRKNLRAGFQMTCLGDRGSFTYKKSRQQNSPADRAALTVLKEFGDFRVFEFDPADGSDERQYCSPGFNLPVGSLMRTMYARYPEYHTSLDNKDFVSFPHLAESVDAYERILKLIDANRVLRNEVQFCEPQLGKRGLYPSLGGQKEIEDRVRSMMWLINLTDGHHDLIQIAERSGQPVDLLLDLADELEEKGLLAPADKMKPRHF